MNRINNFIELTRLNKPIGFMLLFWPCLWGLALAFNQNSNVNLFTNYAILFLLGSILMRSAGCIFNDIVDKNFDKKVNRTKNRPIAAGRISLFDAYLYIIVLCLIALIILMQFNPLTVFLGLASIPLAFSYPFMKRLTYWPQFFLGITFSWGIILAWTSIIGEIFLEPILLYISAIFWTLGYDTIYGFQDIEDDEVIGVKSTSIKFKKNYKIFIGICYLVCFLFLITAGSLKQINIYFLLFSLLPGAHLLNQLRNLNKNDKNSCLNIFRSNNFFGFLVFLSLISMNI